MSEKTRIFIETDIETFFRPKFSHRDSQNNYKSLDTEKSRDEMSHSVYDMRKMKRMLLISYGYLMDISKMKIMIMTRRRMKRMLMISYIITFSGER